MGTRDRWLVAGVEVLRTEGEKGLRIDRLARRLGLTKGSFHHHFAGAPDYRRALLAHCCVRADADLAAARARLAAATPAEIGAALPGLADALHDFPLDVALRGWAASDPGARTAVEAIDGARLAFFEEQWTAATGDPAAARVAALVPHLVRVGASVSPGLRDEDVAAVLDAVAGVTPSA